MTVHRQCNGDYTELQVTYVPTEVGHCTLPELEYVCCLLHCMSTKIVYSKEKLCHAMIAALKYENKTAKVRFHWLDSRWFCSEQRVAWVVVCTSTELPSSGHELLSLEHRVYLSTLSPFQTRLDSFHVFLLPGCARYVRGKNNQTVWVQSRK